MEKALGPCSLHTGPEGELNVKIILLNLEGPGTVMLLFLDFSFAFTTIQPHF